MTGPKLFISYSWSNPDHELWVVDLATQLRVLGVDVILDKWDLKEGHDAVAFMEKMVTDPDIRKVAIITDETYAAKADGRFGGVGTETQIISKEVYEKQEQDKFVAVVSQKDAEGKPYLPTYYKSRIYIDLSEPDKYGENFEKLLRWIFDKPLHVKPELGKKPSFLENNDNSIVLGTTVSFKRAIDAVKNNKTFASGAVDEYFYTFLQNLEKFRLQKPDGEFDEAVIKNIESFIPYRNEAIQMFIAISQYSPSDEYIQKLHRFFENLIPYMRRPEHIASSNEWDFDNFKFIVHELFLYAVAILIRLEHFDKANYLLEQKYYLPGNSDYGRDVMIDFTVFREEICSLRNKRLNLLRPPLRADLLKERCSGIGVEFRHLMQADFVIFMRSEIEADKVINRWVPETLPCLGHSHSPFEIFARSISNKYFEKIKCLLAINVPSGLDDLLKRFNEGERRLPTWDFESFSPAVLLGYKQLATRP